MKTTSLFSRVIIAFLLSLGCINANAQIPPKIAAAFGAGVLGLGKQQDELRRLIERITSQQIGKQQWGYHPNYQGNILGVGLPKAATQALQTEQLSTKLTFTPSAEELNMSFPYAEKLGEAYHKNSIESIKWLEKSAHEDSLLRQVELGYFYLKAKDYTNAVKYWEMATTNNNKLVRNEKERAILSRAYFGLGSLYLNGKLGTPNEEKAINYFKEASNYGHPFSPIFLEMIYSKKG